MRDNPLHECEGFCYDKTGGSLVHPFGCLVSHVCERGIMKKLHELYPNVNIHTVEYDYDSTCALRESRILLGIGGKNAFF